MFFPIMDPARLDTAKERPVNSVMARTEDGMIVGLAHCLKEMGWLVFPYCYEVRAALASTEWLRQATKEELAHNPTKRFVDLGWQPEAMLNSEGSLLHAKEAIGSTRRDVTVLRTPPVAGPPLPDPPDLRSRVSTPRTPEAACDSGDEVAPGSPGFLLTAVERRRVNRGRLVARLSRRHEARGRVPARGSVVEARSRSM